MILLLTSSYSLQDWLSLRPRFTRLILKHDAVRSVRADMISVTLDFQMSFWALGPALRQKEPLD